MLVIRCTRELLQGVTSPVTDEVTSTTALGDWFAQQVIVGDQSYLLLVSRLSRLPLVIPGSDVAGIVSGFAGALEEVLLSLDVAPEAVAHEVDQCREIVFAAGDGSSVRASGNYFARRMKRYLPGQPPEDPKEISLRLGEVPLKSLGFALPSEATRRLFE
jgi:hypothetical protein